MNTIVKYEHLVIGFFMLFFSVGTAQVIEEYKMIYGVWQSSEDPEWTMEFRTNHHCYWSFKGVQQDVYKYSISDTPPVCNVSITVEANDGFLKLSNLTDPQDIYCYHINLLDNNVLEVSRIGKKGSGLKTFEKVK